MNITFEDLSKPQLINRLTAAIWNDGFGCFNRSGFEKVIWPDIVGRAHSIIYFDVDGVHDLNKLHKTYDVFNWMMHQVLATIRSSDYVAAQWNSGDEFLIVLCDAPKTANDRRQQLDPQSIVDRLTAELAKHGLTAIFQFCQVSHQDLISNVKPMADKVLEIKEQTGRAR